MTGSLGTYGSRCGEWALGSFGGAPIPPLVFPTGWQRQCPLVIQSSVVIADQTHFPVCLTNATNCLPAEMVTAGDPNAAQANGGDIRFSTDILGASQIPCEVVNFLQNATASLATVEIWVPVDILDAANVTIYIWYKTASPQSQPDADDTFGSQAVWDANFTIVEHFGNGTVLSVLDSTSNANDGTNNNGAAAAGKFGGGINFSLASRFVSFAAGAPSGTAARTFEFWENVADSGTGLYYDQGAVATGQRNQIVTGSTGADTFIDINGASRNMILTNTRTSTWHFLALTMVTDINQAIFYFDGTAPAMGVATLALATAATPILLNQSVAGGLGQVGSYDEFRISDVVRSASWLNSTYATQNSPGTFTIAGTPVVPGSGSVGNPLSGVNPLQGFIA